MTGGPSDFSSASPAHHRRRTRRLAATRGLVSSRRGISVGGNSNIAKAVGLSLRLKAAIRLAHIPTVLRENKGRCGLWICGRLGLLRIILGASVFIERCFERIAGPDLLLRNHGKWRVLTTYVEFDFLLPNVF